MASMESLAATIVEKLAIVAREAGARSMPSPSLDDASPSAGYAKESMTLREARTEIARAARSLWFLAQAPEDNILQLAWSAADSGNLAVLLRYGFPERVPLDGTIKLEDLAAASGLTIDLTRRVMRYAIGNGLFRETEAGVFAHNRNSAALGRSEHLRNVASVGTGWVAHILPFLADALESQFGPKAVAKPPHCAFNLAFRTDEDIFNYMTHDSTLADAYHNYQVGRTHHPRWDISHIVAARDWSTVGSGTVVDVGGSAGQTVLALAPACPNAKLVVQDFELSALEQGRKTTANMPGVAGRIEFLHYDFFKPNTVQADIYIYRHIFHDWSDENVVKILKNQVPAFKDGATIIVSEAIVPEPPAGLANTLDEKQVLVEDTFMMGIHMAKERTINDFIKLFKEADPNFEYVTTSGGTNGAFQSLVEFRYNRK